MSTLEEVVLCVVCPLFGGPRPFLACYVGQAGYLYLDVLGVSSLLEGGGGIPSP